MPFKFSNNASTTIADANFDNAPTTVTLNVVSAAGFPVITGAETFRIAVEDSSGQFEICGVTNVSGNQFTVTRGEEGTSLGDFSAGGVVELRLTEEQVENFAQKDEAVTFADNVTVTGAFVANGTAHVGANAIFHEGNDGHTSGLDADTLDGVEGSGYSLAGHDHTADAWFTGHDHDADYAAIDHEHTTLELGGVTDTTLSRASAGQVAVEGKALLVHDGAFTSGKVRIVTVAPTDGDGANGDIWLVV